MHSLTFPVIFVVAIVYQASCAPLGGGQVATRDHPRENPASQSEQRLEKELRQKAKGHVALKTAVPDERVPLSPIQRTPSPVQTVTVYSGRVEGVTGEQESPERLSDTNGDSHSSDENDDNAKSSSTSDVSVQQDTIPSVEDLSTEPDADLVEEEEFLRTIITTLRDNPGLMKALIESDREEDEDFYKQKSQVSDPDDSEFWGSFQRPSPQVQQMPKQVVKKAGQRADYRESEDSEKPLEISPITDDSSEEQMFPKIAEVNDEEDSAQLHGAQFKKPLGTEYANEQNRHQGDDTNAKQDADVRGVSDGSESEQWRSTVVDEMAGDHDPHFDEQASYSETRADSANEADQQASVQMDEVNKHVPVKIQGDNDETELQALSKLRSQASNPKQKQTVHPHM